jgi:cyclopropane fatty-acyl-phospholipid synthase-like methyltransferase
MVWREEQRAIGELMIGDSREKGNLKMLSFASFVEQYDSTFARWLANFEADLRSPRAETSPRLESLEHQFEQLVKAIATPMNIN